MEAGKLVVGEFVNVKHGPVQISGIQVRPGKHDVFNLEIHERHNYLISGLGILDHNSCVVATKGNNSRNFSFFELEQPGNNNMQHGDGHILKTGTVKSRTDYLDDVFQWEVHLDHGHGKLGPGHVVDFHINPDDKSKINKSKARGSEPVVYLSPVFSDPRTRGGVFRP